MAVILPSVYKDGTATVNNGGTTVTGQNTLFMNSVLPGDFFGVHRGFAVRIASVDSNTSLTLANPWPGVSQTTSAYEIMLQSDNARMQETSRQLLQTLSSGNAYSLAQLNGTPGDIPVFQSPGVFSKLNLANPSSYAQYNSSLAALGGITPQADRLPYFTGSNSASVVNFGATGKALVAAGTQSEARNAIGSNPIAFGAGGGTVTTGGAGVRGAQVDWISGGSFAFGTATFSANSGFQTSFTGQVTVYDVSTGVEVMLVQSSVILNLLPANGYVRSDVPWWVGGLVAGRAIRASLRIAAQNAVISIDNSQIYGINA